jgi:hypothetical protein
MRFLAPRTRAAIHRSLWKGMFSEVRSPQATPKQQQIHPIWGKRCV